MAALGVGLVGAGPVTQAIHLPTLARLSDDFTVVHVLDVDAATAAAVADRVGATSSTSLDAVLADPRVEVVAICSPNPFHAAQAVAACEAGKRAVLVEKPLATTVDEAAEIAAASARTGVPVLVGAMHTFDPGWLAVRAHWGRFPDECHTIRSSVVLPLNDRFEDVATEVVDRPAPAAADLTDPAVRAAFVRGGVLGLAIHDLPLVRALVPRSHDVVVRSAHLVSPFGYQIVLDAGGRRVVLHAAMSTTWRPDWALDAWSDTQALHVDFTPSYVHAGSAVASLTSAGSTRTWGPEPHNGYEGEWRAMAAVVAGRQTPPAMTELVDDLRFATRVADAAVALVSTADLEPVSV